MLVKAQLMTCKPSDDNATKGKAIIEALKEIDSEEFTTLSKRWE